jgi:hypothetical protein
MRRARLDLNKLFIEPRHIRLLPLYEVKLHSRGVAVT